MTFELQNIPQKWLITGGCGFIGTALIKQLVSIEKVMQIRILDNLSVGTRSDLSKVCDFVDFSNLNEKNEGVFLQEGDILDQSLCNKISKNVDCVVHLAANTGVPQSVENPRKDMEINVVGTFNMLEAARINGIKQFVFASSGAPAGEVEPPIHEEIAPHPVSPYGSSKLSGEGYCSSYGRTFGINTVVLRFGNVYGPGSKRKTSVVAKFIKNVLNGLPCKIYGDGTQTRDFIFVHDLVDAIIKASQLSRGGEIFQIATSSEKTVNEIAKIIKQQLWEYLKIEMKIVYGEKRSGDVIRNYSDVSKAKKMLGWETKVDIDTGIRKTIKYFIKLNG